ncbi:MAG: site-specific integrase [Phycisphaerales bacterium]|nr:site-specific integrase [Phycisphaerales bacterium]
MRGRRVYLGAFDAPESHEAYARTIAEWSAGRSFAAGRASERITVTELVVRFLDYADRYYGTEGPTTKEPLMFRLAARPLLRLYGRTEAGSFAPSCLHTVREEMIRTGWARKYVNQQAGRLKRVFKWGVTEGLVPPSVWHGLTAVEGLKRGRCDARETDPIPPVSDDVVNTTLPHLTPTLRAMVQFHRHTGCRPQEACLLRPCDVDRSGAVWTYRPMTHKTAHHGHERVIHVGPKGQEILRPLLLRTEPTAFVFTPQRSEQERRDAVHAARTTPESCGNRPGTNRKKRPSKAPGDRWDSRSYAKAIQAACERAGVPHWSPNQLRHAFATEIRRLHGLEAAQVLLGHARADVTQVYAERDHAKAAAVAALVG